MKALTICQPYAELIACGLKRVENRPWFTGYRGPLAIHAGKNRTWLSTYRPLPPEMDFGAIIELTRLVACFSIATIRRLLADDPFAWLKDHIHSEGPYCLVLGEVRRLAEPIPCPGKLGLWDFSLEGLDDVATIPATTRPGHCRVCGCTDEYACPEGCKWLEPNLCTRCIGRG